MSTFRPCFRGSIFRDSSFRGGAFRSDADADAVLTDITLTSGTITADSRTLLEGGSLNVNYRPILATLFSGLRNWSEQLSLDSIASTQQYNERTDAVVVDRELVQADFGTTFNWHGVHQNRNQAGVPEDDDGNPIYSSVFYSIDDDEPFLYVSALGGIWSGYSNPIASLNLGIEAWLDSRTLDELETFFEGEPFSATTAYVYFDPARPTQMRVILGATGWTPASFDWIDMVAGTDYEGIDTTELTTDDTDLLSSGLQDIALAANTITADIDDTFRIKTDFVEGTATVTVLQPIDLENVADSTLKSIVIGGKRLVVGGKSPVLTGA